MLKNRSIWVNTNWIFNVIWNHCPIVRTEILAVLWKKKKKNQWSQNETENAMFSKFTDYPADHHTGCFLDFYAVVQHVVVYYTISIHYWKHLWKPYETSFTIRIIQEKLYDFLMIISSQHLDWNLAYHQHFPLCSLTFQCSLKAVDFCWKQGKESFMWSQHHYSNISTNIWPPTKVQSDTFSTPNKRNSGEKSMSSC